MQSIVAECILRAATHATLRLQDREIIIVRNLAQGYNYLDTRKKRHLALEIMPARRDLFG